MKKYLDKAKQLQRLLSYFQLVPIPRSQNVRADTLSKIASTSTASPVEEIQMRGIKEVEVCVIIEDDPNWMTSLQTYLEKNELPEEKAEARKILSKSLRYIFQEGVLYWKSYLQPLLQCVGPNEADYVMRKVHVGACGSHIGPRALTKMIMRWGYY